MTLTVRQIVSLRLSPWETVRALCLAGVAVLAVSVRLRLALFAGLLLAITGCATVCAHATTTVNQCLVKTLAYNASLSAHNQLESAATWRRILLVTYNDQRLGHVVSVFEHKGRLWCYDPDRGSFEIGILRSRDAFTVAYAVWGWRVKHAEWLDGRAS